MFYRLRMHPSTGDLGAFIHEAVNAMSGDASQHQAQQQGQGYVGQQMLPLQHGQPGRHHQPTQQYQQQQLQQSGQQNLQQHSPTQPNDQGIFAQPSYNTAAPAPNQLPPLRSIVELPTGGINSAQLPQPYPRLTQRHMSQVSNMSSGSYTSLSSSDGYRGQSLSPREDAQ